jgi:hypothetical protein
MKALVFLLFILCLTPVVYSSDVVVGGSVIPNFNAPNLSDVSLTNVTVTFNSTAVSCSNCFRQQWVGLSGFRIAIEGVPYTVAYVSGRSNLTLTTVYQAGSTSSATILWYKYVELRIYADSSFQPLGKTYIVQPGAPGSGAWYRRIATSIVNELGTNNLYIPALTLDATTDSPTNQAARYSAAFYRPEGGLIQIYDCFDSFAVPPTGAASWPELCTFNQRQVVVQDTSTYTKSQIDAMRTGCSTGQSLYYASTGLRPDCLIFGSGLQLTGNTLSATAANAYTTVLGNGSPVTQRAFLNFLAPFTVADNAGIPSTDVGLDADLGALANLSGTGGIFRTGTNTYALRTLTGTAGNITVTNGDGVAGPPTFNTGANIPTNANNLSFFASTTSAQLAGVISNETGTGALVFGTSPTIATPRITTAIADANGNELFTLNATGSAVNEISITNGAAGTGPTIAVSGNDTNPNLNINAKGTGRVVVKGYPYAIEVNTTTVGTVGGGLDTLQSYTLPAGSLASNGDYLDIFYGGGFAANSNAKTLSLTFGGANIINTGALDLRGEGWSITVRVVRLSSTSILTIATIHAGFVATSSANVANGGTLGGVVYADNDVVAVSDLGSNTLSLIVQGLGTADNDVVQSVSIIALVQR